MHHAWFEVDAKPKLLAFWRGKQASKKNSFCRVFFLHPNKLFWWTTYPGVHMWGRGSRGLCVCLHTCTDRCNPMASWWTEVLSGDLLSCVHPATGFQPQTLGMQRVKCLTLKLLSWEEKDREWPTWSLLPDLKSPQNEILWEQREPLGNLVGKVRRIDLSEAYSYCAMLNLGAKTIPIHHKF